MALDNEQTIFPEESHPYLEREHGEIPRVKVLSGGLAGREFSLTKEKCVIGRNPASDIVIEEQHVSRKHAVIVRKSSEYVLCDLMSTNGVFMNNLKLDKSVLKNGDLFQIGSCIFQFVWRRA